MSALKRLGWTQAVLPVSPGTQVYEQGCAEPDGALSAMIERVLTAQGFAPHPVGRQLLTGGAAIRRLLAEAAVAFVAVEAGAFVQAGAGMST